MAIIIASILAFTAFYIGALMLTGATVAAETEPTARTGSPAPSCHTVTAKTFNKRVRLLERITGKNHHNASRPVCKHTVYKRLLGKIKRAKAAYCWKQGVKCWIRKAARKYHQPVADAMRVAECESGFDPNNSYAGHYGLFQFLPSTFATTPYRNRDIWSPKWNSYAAMWMWSVGRRGEWACQ